VAGSLQGKGLREAERVEEEPCHRDDEQGDHEDRRVADEDREHRVAPLVARQAEGEGGHEQELQVDAEGERDGGARAPSPGQGQRDGGSGDERDPRKRSEADGRRRQPEKDTTRHRGSKKGGSAESHRTSLTPWTPSSWLRGRGGAYGR